jgi:hypothetical protein
MNVVLPPPFAPVNKQKPLSVIKSTSLGMIPSFNLTNREISYAFLIYICFLVVITGKHKGI